MSRDHVQSAERTDAEAAGPALTGAETPFLELLARGASSDAYEQPVLLARAEGRSAEAIAALEHAKLLALRVRADLEGRRRREAELSALFETAHDLAGLRDLDSVLQAIVQRARSLLGTDVAYLSLNDPDRRDTYMRVTEGSVAARFQQLRLGMGRGSADSWPRPPVRTSPTTTSRTTASSTRTPSTAVCGTRAWSPSSACP